MKTKSLLAFLFLSFFSEGCSLKQNPSQNSQEEWGMAYFKTNSPELYLATSKDGRNWKEINDGEAVLKSEVGEGIIRDPSIVLGNDRLYHLVWTTAQTGFGYASSSDLIHWSEQRLIDVRRGPLAKNLRSVWAPEIVLDQNKNDYLVIWSSSTRQVPGLMNRDKGNHRCFYSRTQDFKNWSTPKLLLNPHPDVYTIDCALLQAEEPDRDPYYIFLKVEAHNIKDGEKDGLALTHSKKFEGPYTRLSATLPLATGDSEGPSPIKIGDTYFVYYDYGALASKDLRYWENISEEVKLPKNFRHGNVFRLSAPTTK